eukprot:scaffold11804_cov30-Cyclotella_meneghiniana.AAC.2
MIAPPRQAIRELYPEFVEDWLITGTKENDETRHCQQCQQLLVLPGSNPSFSRPQHILTSQPFSIQ